MDKTSLPTNSVVEFLWDNSRSDEENNND